jgi:hypothetical protein
LAASGRCRWLFMFSLLQKRSSVLWWVFRDEEKEVLLLAGGCTTKVLRTGKFWRLAEKFLLNYILTLLF